MSSTKKKVLVIFAGGGTFAKTKEDKEQGIFQATEQELRAHIDYDLKDRLSNDVDISFQYLGGDLHGVNKTPKDWNELGQEIANQYYDYDGFVVLHGQDTIPWAGSQLAFSLQNLAKPVIFGDGAGSFQDTSATIKSEQLVITAAQLAAFSNISEVSVLSSNVTLLKAVDAIQYNANTHSGFVSRNNRILAHIGAELLLEPDNIKPKPIDELFFEPIDTSLEITAYHITPVVPPPMQAYITEKTAGVVLQTSGNGFVPLDQAGIRKTLGELKERKIPTLAITTCNDGYINFNAITMGQELEKLGVIQGGSMTFPAAMTKLRVAVSKQIPYEDIADFMAQDLFGETLSKLPIVQIPSDERTASLVI